MGAGGVQEAGGRRKRVKLRNIVQYFVIEKKRKQAGATRATKIGRESGLRGTGGRSLNPSVPLPAAQEGRVKQQVS